MKTSLLILFTLVFFLQTPLFSEKKHEVAICAIFQDEAPWLKEWIEYHKLLGVTHFRLYNNESSDDFRTVLAPYIKQGLVLVVDWPTAPFTKEYHNFVNRTQLPAYEDGLKKLKNHAKWVACIDTDEFIVPFEATSLPEFLKDYEAYGGVALNWICFGTSHIENIPEDKLLIETLTWRAHDWERHNRYEKCIVRPKTVEKIKNPHFFIHFPHTPLVWDDKTLHQHQIVRTPQKIQINHYIVRTLGNLKEKVRKKEQMVHHKLNDEEISLMYNFGNDFEDPQKYIFRFVPQLKSACGK